MRPAAIRPLGSTGKVPVIDDKDGRHPKHETMAGSPDADLDARSASRRLAHGFCFLERPFFS
jgi:hypothetical protein